jgi:hypothetical protein
MMIISLKDPRFGYCCSEMSHINLGNLASNQSQQVKDLLQHLYLLTAHRWRWRVGIGCSVAVLLQSEQQMDMQISIVTSLSGRAGAGVPIGSPWYMTWYFYCINKVDKIIGTMRKVEKIVKIMSAANNILFGESFIPTAARILAAVHF